MPKMRVDKWGQFKAGNLLCSFFILQKAHKNNCKQGKDEAPCTCNEGLQWKQRYSCTHS